MINVCSFPYLSLVYYSIDYVKVKSLCYSYTLHLRNGEDDIPGEYPISG